MAGETTIQLSREPTGPVREVLRLEAGEEDFEPWHSKDYRLVRVFLRHGGEVQIDRETGEVTRT
jgi:hypothetical protein